jgi:hypothetical protein
MAAKDIDPKMDFLRSTAQNAQCHHSKHQLWQIKCQVLIRPASNIAEANRNRSILSAEADVK